MLDAFLLILTSFTAGLLIWPLYRLFHPFQCTCGHSHLSARKMIEHIGMKHQL